MLHDHTFNIQSAYKSLNHDNIISLTESNCRILGCSSVQISAWLLHANFCAKNVHKSSPVQSKLPSTTAGSQSTGPLLFFHSSLLQH